MCEALEELMKDKIEEKAEERAKIIAEEKAQIIAEEKAQIIAEEKAQIIAEEKLKTIMSEILDDKIEMAQNRINELNCALIKANRVDDVIKAAMDKEYQKKLFEEFDL